MAGPDLEEDLPFRHYTLKHRLIAGISMQLFDTATDTVSPWLANHFIALRIGDNVASLRILELREYLTAY
jgi:hypothetical protein